MGRFAFKDGDYDNDPCGLLAALNVVVVDHPQQVDIDSMTVPKGSHWKDSSFLSNLLETIDDEE